MGIRRPFVDGTNSLGTTQHGASDGAQGAQCLFFLLNRILDTCVCLPHLLREVVWMRGGLADADEGPDEETTVLSPAVAPQD